MFNCCGDGYQFIKPIGILGAILENIYTHINTYFGELYLFELAELDKLDAAEEYAKSINLQTYNDIVTFRKKCTYTGRYNIYDITYSPPKYLISDMDIINAS